MKIQQVSLLIGLCITGLITYLGYDYIHRQSLTDYQKDYSAYYESLEWFQSRIDDLKLTGRDYTNSQAPVALIAIDDLSIEEIGRWPWSRTTLSQLSEQVLENGASSITFDILLSEPERENKNADQILGSTVEKFSDKFILGTSSSDQSPKQLHPYQDICATEAFLFLGGDRIITLNPTFTVDDQSQSFDEYNWSILFTPIFQHITQVVKNQTLEKSMVSDESLLNEFQKNSLASQTRKAINNYCEYWLTQEDDFLKPGSFQNILPVYSALINKSTDNSTLKILDEAGFHQFVSKIKTMKSHPIPQYLGWYSNTPQIQDKSKYTASFNTKMDSDGYIRKYPLFLRVGSRIGTSFIPSLALQSYLVSQNYRAEVGLVESESSVEKVMTHFKIYDMENDKDPLYQIPVDSFGQLRINYYGPEKSFYYVSAKELITKKTNNIEVQIRRKNGVQTEIVDKAKFFKGRAVLVGATALGIYDMRNTPVQNAFPGPEIHLTALANLLEKNFIVPLKNEIEILPIVIFVLGLVSTLLWSYLSSLLSLTFFFSGLPVLILIDYFIYSRFKIFIQNWPLYFVFIFTFIGISLFKYFAEEKDKLKVKKAFSKYVSPTVLDELLKSEKNLALGGQKKTLTVVFSDLRGFTTFSEKLEPKALSDFLNMYLTRMTEEIFKTKGTVDKYIGDAIMAFFGAPVEFKNHPHMACRCALASIQTLAKLNDELKGRDFPLLDMGLGINTGEMSVGNMGSSTIQNYTVMGDSVNLASRLEGLTRYYGNNIVIGDATYEAVKNEFTCRELDRVIVKGKTQAISIYDLLYEGPAMTGDQEWLSTYKSAREKYVEGQLQQAYELFEKTLSLRADDKVAAFYVKKLKDLLSKPIEENWSPVNILRSK